MSEKETQRIKLLLLILSLLVLATIFSQVFGPNVYYNECISQELAETCYQYGYTTLYHAYKEGYVSVFEFLTYYSSH